MSDDLRKRLTAKCIQIYERKRRMRPVQRFLDRLNIENNLRFQVLDEDFVREARQKYFPAMTMDSLQEDLLLLYRSKRTPFNGISAIWWRIDNEVPLSCDEYCDLTAELTKKLSEEPNPPSNTDWDYLDEELMK